MVLEQKVNWRFETKLAISAGGGSVWDGSEVKHNLCRSQYQKRRDWATKSAYVHRPPELEWNALWEYWEGFLDALSVFLGFESALRDSPTSLTLHSPFQAIRSHILGSLRGRDTNSKDLYALLEDLLVKRFFWSQTMDRRRCVDSHLTSES